MAKARKFKGSLKISFLIAAHNEEKIISKTLENLNALPYDNYEVILGLDGCTDSTLDIVKRFASKNRKIRYFNLNIREGKPAVINYIIKKSKGEIVIINDADWIFRVKNRDSLNGFLSVFEDESIGGVAENFPIEWDSDLIRNGNFPFKVIAYSSYLWERFQNRRYVFRPEGSLRNGNLGFGYLTESTMFLTNVFRRKLYVPNSSLGDDFERTKDIFNQGKKVVIFNNEDMPRMISVINRYSFRDIFKQKVRTAIARNQIKSEQKLGFFNYYLPLLWFMFTRSFSLGLTAVFSVFIWFFIMVASTIVASFKLSTSTKEGWKMRAQRR